MDTDFEQISLKPGFMKHNGGLLFKTISKEEYEFKTTIKENHLNAAGITHGGFIAALVDAGAGTAAHRSADNNPCVTISLERDRLEGRVRIGICMILHWHLQGVHWNCIGIYRMCIGFALDFISLQRICKEISRICI